MARTDGLLYTGMSSMSFVKERAKREERKKEKAKKKNDIEPFTAEILKAIKKERDTIGLELAGIIHTEMSEADVKATVLGLRKADERIKKLEMVIQNIVRAS